MRLQIRQTILDDPRGYEDQKFLLVVSFERAAEQSSDIGQISEERRLRGRDVLICRENAAEYQRLAIIYQHLSFNLIGVD